MNPAEARFRELPLPQNYFCGQGFPTFPLPQNILLFYRGGAFDPRVLNSGYSQSHHRYVAIFNFSEPLTIILDEAIVRIGEREGLLILPYQYHRFIDEKQEQLSLAFVTFTLHEGPEKNTTRKVRVQDGGEHSANRKTENSVCGPYWEHCRGRAFRYDQRALATLDELVSDYQSDHTETLPYRLGLLLQQSCPKDAPKNGKVNVWPEYPEANGRNRLIVQMIQAVQRDLSQTIANLSQSLGYSESYLRSHFKGAMGLPLGRFILELRLAKAKKLLLESDWAVSRIAENCGYASLYAFSHSFKVHNRLSPRQYRQNVRKQQRATEQKLFEQQPQYKAI